MTHQSLSPFGNTRLLLTLIALAGLRVASAATIYSNFQNIAIPTDFTGVYLDIDNATSSTSSFTGWDINPFFGGVGIGNSAAFQPVRIGTSNLDRDLNLAVGTLLPETLNYSSGVGGSGNTGHEHIGPASDQFQVGTEGYLGFQFTKNGTTQVLNGWMRLTLTNNTAGAAIKDWAYDDAGSSISIGRVQQSAAAGGLQTVTLSPGGSESFTLGSVLADTGGNINSLLKTDTGSTRLGTANTFSGATTITGGVLEAGTAGALGSTAAVTVNTGGTLLLSGSGNRVKDNAGLTLAGGKLDAAGLSETVGALTLTADSKIDFGAGGSLLSFASANLQGHRLDLWNWTGTTGTGGGLDQIRFGDTAALASQLDLIHFYSNAGDTEISFTSANYQNGVVGSSGEITPVSEPATVAGGILLCLVSWREFRRSSSSKRRAARAI